MSDISATPTRIRRHCPVCGGERNEPRFEKGPLRVVGCSQCGMMFASPVAKEFVEGSFYERMAAPFYLSPDKLESDYAAVRFARELRLFRRYCPSGAVLDVGCSTGAFLHQLSQRFPGDYATLGADVAGPALDYAERRGVPVLRAPLLEHDFGGRRFDAVTMWAVLEHLAEPARFLARAAAVLKPGGHCLVLVPNFRSLAVRLLGPRYRYIMAEHLNYFSSDTLKRLAARAPAFAVIAMRSTHFNPVVLWQDWRRATERVPDAERARLLRRTTRWKQNAALAPLRFFYSAIERVLGSLRLADNLTLVLRRTDQAEAKEFRQRNWN
jgi:2-polyprenyl-3-methyl-5-hydroxy-6-metoxy-1,4-benzoquinol methylase